MAYRVAAALLITGWGVTQLADQGPGRTGYLLLAAAAVVLVGPARMRVVAGTQGIEVRNFLRTVRIPWAEVADVDMDGGFPHVPRVELHDGRRISLWGICDDPWLDWRRPVGDAEGRPDGLLAVREAWRLWWSGA